MAITTREGKTQTTLAEINMIPFIDIVLVLLIIFMVTAPVIQSGIEVNVPKTQVVREIAEEKLIVSIDKEQKLYLQNDPVNVNELGDKIREKLLDPTRQSVYLRADQSVPFQTFATVLDHLKLAGIENVSIVTQPLTQGRK
ncbi:MAG: biopolymer transporter ExbD [Acidobacteria bacterium]|nr:MAG: biopolymer transporter ExbD [Acidobacteria bacterium 13_1_40CM_56_16]PYR87158.1 MAG: biopolymer transporter ExbD [Acidobacteriota bacterium]